MASSDFARRQLEKHGWKKGAGLGKEQEGITDPIKVKLKMDKAGMGHDPAKEFTDHWWLRVFNDAAKKIGSKEKDAKKSEKSKAKEKVEKKQSFYAGFVKSSTLTNGIEEKAIHSDVSSDDDENAHANSVPSLNDIHKFCGGATGHKAARFGIKMGGKLARVAKHDQMFEERLKSDAGKLESQEGGEVCDSVMENVGILNGSTVEEQSSDQKSSRKAKKKKRKSKDHSVNVEVCEESSETEVTQRKKKKNKRKNQDRSDSECLVVTNVDEDQDADGRVLPQADKEADSQEVLKSDEKSSRKKEKRKRKKEEMEAEDIEKNEKSKKKKKKKK